MEASASMSPSIDVAGEWYSLLFGVRRSVRYHMRRVRFFDQWNLVTNALSLSFGSATILAVLGGRNSSWAVGAAAVVTVFSLLNLLMGSTRRAREHNDLARRFIALEKAMVLLEQPTPADLKRCTAQRLDIEGDEPPVLRVLDILCHNEQALAEGHPREVFVQVKWYQRWLAQFMDIGADRLTHESSAS